ncbi:Type 1 glutamine amidotransferase-like domain-containing protein [Pedobacter aquatilis]|uniref:Type 1 glutamine amidotransferase-like domain-containing protein n=1 Tax=Pedobacter aquatilis TaxID=351343 RepID=UPI0029307A80|nr:Type 1 glutamine amidotransferase-like domain-containing protein [Pedobacter aquatilis]
MKLLLTSNGITNPSLYQALVALLGKPIEESTALFIPTAIYPFAGGGIYAMQAINGRPNAPLTQLGWKSLGILELSVLSSIRQDIWVKALKETDVLLVWGGDPLFLAYWFKMSGVADLMPSLADKMVYVGVSAGSIAASSIFGETYSEPSAGVNYATTSKTLVFGTAQRIFCTAEGLGLAEFAIIPHYENPEHQDASKSNAAIWAAQLSLPVYAIDDETGIKVSNGEIEVVSEGQWKLFNA